jgi:hypothetical protein
MQFSDFDFFVHQRDIRFLFVCSLECSLLEEPADYVSEGLLLISAFLAGRRRLVGLDASRLPALSFQQGVERSLIEKLINPPTALRESVNQLTP